MPSEYSLADGYDFQLTSQLHNIHKLDSTKTNLIVGRKNRMKQGDKVTFPREGEKTCFVICPIGEANSEIRKRSDQVFKHIISPAVEPLKYTPIRADQISEPGIITSQVIQHVVESKLVIADLSGHNPNVFYELAIRHAITEPLVQLISKGEQIPFDVAGTRTIQFDIHDLDNVQETKQELINQIKSVESGKTEIDTPISVTLDLKKLKESGKPEDRSLVDMMGELANLRKGILGIEKRLDDPERLLPPEYLNHLLKRAGKSTVSIETYREVDMMINEFRDMSRYASRQLEDNKKLTDKEKRDLVEPFRMVSNKLEEMSYGIRRRL